MTKYIFVTGGVVSGLGKGITAASLGRLLKSRGFRVTMQKFDPYLNIDPGMMDPFQHGEVYVTDDGAECDLDLGHYERFIDESLHKGSNITAGKIYWSVLSNEREGKYGGGTVQLIPHITNEIKERIAYNKEKFDFAIIEIGGTVGDIESQPFLEAIRQFASDVGRQNCAFIHVTLVPYISASHEVKTKPTQHSVKELLSIGIQPDFLVCRTEHPFDNSIRDKIGLFCNVNPDHVIINYDMDTLYEVPVAMLCEGIDVKVCKDLNVDPGKIDFTEWSEMVSRAKNLQKSVNIAIVGKYIGMPDAYLSVVEALNHGGIDRGCKAKIVWIDSEEINDENAASRLSGCDGIVIPSGFGARGTDGKIAAAKYARENSVPMLGICLGMYAATVDFARNVAGLNGAHSADIDTDTPYPVFIMPENDDSMRLGKYPCKLLKGSLAEKLYGASDIDERHRHRYEFNKDYSEILEKNGLCISGTSPDGDFVEIIELPGHPFYIGTQFQPEFKSRPNRAHPLYKGFISAALDFSVK